MNPYPSSSGIARSDRRTCGRHASSSRSRHMLSWRCIPSRHAIGAIQPALRPKIGIVIDCKDPKPRRTMRHDAEWPRSAQSPLSPRSYSRACRGVAAGIVSPHSASKSCATKARWSILNVLRSFSVPSHSIDPPWPSRVCKVTRHGSNPFLTPHSTTALFLGRELCRWRARLPACPLTYRRTPLDMLATNVAPTPCGTRRTGHCAFPVFQARSKAVRRWRVPIWARTPAELASTPWRTCLTMTRKPMTNVSSTISASVKVLPHPLRRQSSETSRSAAGDLLAELEGRSAPAR